MLSEKRMLRISRLVVVVLFFAVLGVANVAPVQAQLPETFTNLQVLPKDIDQRQLMGMMRSFSFALDVRCQHCHVGEEGKPLSTFDFAADEKQAKATARVMMKMVNEVNETFLPQTGRPASARLEVGCSTCHHGQPRPETLVQALTTVLEEGGIEKARAHYQALREQYYGRGTFDFGEDSLNDLARKRFAADKPAEAIALLELNIEQHPKGAMSHFLLGEAYARAGDKKKAIASYVDGLALQPENPRAQKRLEELRGES